MVCVIHTCRSKYVYIYIYIIICIFSHSELYKHFCVSKEVYYLCASDYWTCSLQSGCHKRTLAESEVYRPTQRTTVHTHTHAHTYTHCKTHTHTRAYTETE